eukprot:CAMPEP_0176381726 /NCGR_PEP_ID=MMETSP0126-20121128/32107_1 /TAXON_ID=141414 ORGANISM="Strombidinopsis acuminatum, Strain SPMC142" /NCGR_SAMPLE_ID=MMETSP0126 /ASSEMBLY_ACC=CAM_ASM_000229 /LENGTH=158 /DNA_ID=CAMNT_0017745713 /DNA_START=243 /DNA_END=720 /DNA_ORIENTATION=+
MTPCGFCFVEYATREEAQLAVDILNKAYIDGKQVRIDWDYGYEHGRQFGRGSSTGGQVRDEMRLETKDKLLWTKIDLHKFTPKEETITITEITVITTAVATTEEIIITTHTMVADNHHTNIEITIAVGRGLIMIEPEMTNNKMKKVAPLHTSVVEEID